MTAPFTARYRGDCHGGCGTPILPGDLVRYRDDDHLEHVDCIPTADVVAARRPAVVCEVCWLTKPCEHDDTP